MRALSAVVLFCVLMLGLSGSVMAGDATDATKATISVANAQLLVNKAKTATTGVYSDVELTLEGGKKVIFTLFRDAVGNVTARPKAGQDTTGISITQVNIQMGANAAGSLTPVSMVVQGSGASLTKNTISFNANGTIASLDQPKAVEKAVTGGTGTPGTGTPGGTNTPDPFANPFLSVSGGGQLPLPAGAESGKISVWQP